MDAGAPLQPAAAPAQPSSAPPAPAQPSAAPPAPALSLEFILGVDAAPAHATPGGALFYSSGAYGVLLNPADGLQRHLRGHAGPLTASAVAGPGGRLLLTASADSVIAWDAATGAPLAVAEAPHGGGRVAGLAALPQELPHGETPLSGRVLLFATLGGAPGAQGVAVW